MHCVGRFAGLLRSTVGTFSAPMTQLLAYEARLLLLLFLDPLLSLVRVASLEELPHLLELIDLLLGSIFLGVHLSWHEVLFFIVVGLARGLGG